MVLPIAADIQQTTEVQMFFEIWDLTVSYRMSKNSRASAGHLQQAYRLY